MPAKGLYFIMKALDVHCIVYASDDYSLCIVEHIVRRNEPYQISYLHHAYSIPRQAASVNCYFGMWTLW